MSILLSVALWVRKAQLAVQERNTSILTFESILDLRDPFKDRGLCFGNRVMQVHYCTIIQGAAERTPLFGRGIASGGKDVQWWGARRRTALYVPFSVYTMAWSGEHLAFIVEGFIKMAGRP